jgi:hypothetical protein
MYYFTWRAYDSRQHQHIVLVLTNVLVLMERQKQKLRNWSGLISTSVHKH